MSTDLNALRIPVDGEDARPLHDNSTISDDGSCEVIFRNLERRLISEIEACDAVVGCVAWMTSEPIIRALSRKQGVSIIVQKEDFLRPDLSRQNNWATWLRSLYGSLPPLYRINLPSPLCYMSCASEPSIGVRCVGNHNAEKSPAFPRSHHKFICFCRMVDHENEPWGVSPFAVWTGSFNFTKNAVASFENAVILRDEKIVEAFFAEYVQIACLSEPLNWDSQWSEPEWRIGT